MLLSGFQPAADCTVGLVKKMLIPTSYSSERLLGTSSYHEECYSIFLSNGITIHKGLSDPDCESFGAGDNSLGHVSLGHSYAMVWSRYGGASFPDL